MVSNGTSFTQVAGVILGKQAPVENPDKDDVPKFKSWRVHHTSPSKSWLMSAVHLPVPREPSGGRVLPRATTVS